MQAPELDQQLLATDLEAEAQALPTLQASPKGVYLWYSWLIIHAPAPLGP